MAKRKIIWTKKANIERIEILDYWIKRNQSKNFSVKLNKLFEESISQLSQHPNIGRKSSFKNVRVNILRDYFIFYEFNENEIIILSLWDCRRDENEITTV